MKKIFLPCFALMACLCLTSCSNSQSNSNKSSKDISESREANSLKKANAKLKRNIKKQSSSNSTNLSATNSGNTEQTSQSQNNISKNSNTGKSQSEINRERGYDPNGAPLLPGQDHAAGSNPDGSPDAWVQGQIDWAIQNGYMNPDGTNTPKGQAAEDEVERDSQPGMP